MSTGFKFQVLRLQLETWNLKPETFIAV